MAELVCAVDVETTGLDAAKDNIIEIGAALLDPNTWEVLDKFSTFVQCSIPLPEEIKKLTGITEENLQTGKSETVAARDFVTFAKQATVFMAHNAPFDRAFITKMFSGIHHEDNRKWYCSKGDIKSHVGRNCTRLSHLAVDYGLSVDGNKLHRALDDVLLMARLLQKIAIPLHEIVEYADDPWVYLKAKVSYEDKDKAKADGYGWEKCPGTYGPVVSKSWIKRVKSKNLKEEQDRNVGFKREIIQTVD